MRRMFVLRRKGRRFYDSFDRANTAVAIGTLETGESWSQLSGTWGISTNRAYKPAASGGSYDNCVVDVGSQNGIQRGRVVVSVTDPGFQGWCVRLSDDNNYLRLLIMTTGYNIGDRLAGAFTTYASGGWNNGNLVAGDLVETQVFGSVLTLLKNGEVQATQDVSAFTSPGSRWGLHSYYTDAFFNDFEVLV